MVLPIVVNTDRKIAIDKSKYDHGLDDGLFLTEDGSLGMKRKSGECFDLYGKELNVSRKMGYKCYVEGGIKGIGIEGQTREDWCGDKMSTHVTISHADLKRGINHDWYHANGRICEIELSLSQFADMITSIGNGDGVPCTIHFTERDGYIPRIDYESKIEQHRGEFKDQLSDVKSSIKNAYEIAEELFSSKKTLNKADKQKILDALAKANRDIGCNAEYALDCFNEQMEKSVTEARGEIEAFMQNQIQNIAMKAIATNVDENGLSDFNKMIAIE